MADPSRDRVCSRCRARFTPRRGVLGVACGVGIVTCTGVLMVDALVRPGVMLAGGLCASSALGCTWVVRLLAATREQTCTSCGSRRTVPLLSPAGIDLDQDGAG